MTAPLPTIADRRQRRPALQRGPQRRSAFRISMPMPVYVYAPVDLLCELRDISFTGLGLDQELPCAPGVEVMFNIEESTHGVLVATNIALRAEVVRVELGHTGLRFVDIEGDEPRAVHELIASKQRMILTSRSRPRNPPSFRG